MGGSNKVSAEFTGILRCLCIMEGYDESLRKVSGAEFHG